MLTLYFAPGTCAMAPHIVLEHLGLAHEAQRLDFSRGEQGSAAYLRINPKGRVPALVTERGVLTETPAMLLYLAQICPEAGLVPLDDPFALAQAQSFNSYLCATVHVAHAHRRRGSRWADDEIAQESMRRKVAQNMGDCFELIEKQMLLGPWVLGEQLSICDPYLFTLAGWLSGDGVDIERFPGVANHHRRMLALPAVQRVKALHA